MMKYMYLWIIAFVILFTTNAKGQGICCNGPHPYLTEYCGLDNWIGPYYITGYECNSSDQYYRNLQYITDRSNAIAFWDDFLITNNRWECYDPGMTSCYWRISNDGGPPSYTTICQYVKDDMNRQYAKYVAWVKANCSPVYLPSIPWIPIRTPIQIELAPRLPTWWQLSQYTTTDDPVAITDWPEIAPSGPYSHDDDYGTIFWPQVVWEYTNQQNWYQFVSDVMNNVDVNEDYPSLYDEDQMDVYYQIYVDQVDANTAIASDNIQTMHVQDGLPACFADWNGDSGVDGDDITAFYVSWGNSEADVDYSGGVDGADVTFFYDCWENSYCW